MARSTRTIRSNRKDEGTAVRPVHDQPTPFLGLLLAPLIVLLLTWVIHYAIMGWTMFGHTVAGSPGFLGLAVSLATLGAGGVGIAAWHFSYDRHRVWRYALTGSATIVGMWLPALIYNAPNRFLSIFFVLTAWIVSTIWALPRLHVLRRDPREDGSGDDGDSLMKELGLDGYKSRGKPEVRYDDSGEPTRITVDVRHKFGGKRDKLQAALGNLESAVGAPEGMSRVTAPADGKSNHSIVTVMLKDPFTGRIPASPPSHPGGSVTDYAEVGMYDDGEPVHVWVCGGINPVTGDKMPPTGYAFMGMTRAGKTVTENRLLLDGVITRRDGVILYLNKAKGGQDVQPIIAGVEAAVLSDVRNDYQFAMGKVKDILTYRQKQLAIYGISAWSAKCYSDPPQVTLDGRPVPMEPMPALIVHTGEADAILEEAGEEAVYLASKGLSVGVIMGWSLQRWAATSMPTDLRFNIGCSFCFGVGDSYSADFALSESTIKAGANPALWKNRKPGRFYVENIGIEEHRFAVVAKGIGDTDDDALYGNMKLLAEQYGPQMARLDSGSVNATRGWWAKVVRETDALRLTMTSGTAAPATPAAPAQPAQPVHAAPVPDDPTPQEVSNNVGTFEATDPQPHEDARLVEARHDVAADIDGMTEINGEQIHGDLIKPDEDDPTGEKLFAEMAQVNLAEPIPEPEPDDTDWGGSEPEAPTPQDAQLRFDEALRGALKQEDLRDPADPKSVLIKVSQLRGLYPFRSRPWFSGMLSAMADGGRECPPGIRVSHANDRTGDGWYRITDTSSDT